jgi:acyl-CoA hydrolase
LLHWQDYYQDRTCTAQEAVKVIKPGDFVVVAHACGEPQTLTASI